jgi:hypothetical protein
VLASYRRRLLALVALTVVLPALLAVAVGSPVFALVWAIMGAFFAVVAGLLHRDELDEELDRIAGARPAHPPRASWRVRRAARIEHRRRRAQLREGFEREGLRELMRRQNRIPPGGYG